MGCKTVEGSLVRLSSIYIKDPFDPNNVMKEVVTNGLSAIPTAGPFLSFFVKLFWPNTYTEYDLDSIWEQCLSEIKDMIDDQLYLFIQGVLSSKINETCDKIQFINQIIESHGYADAKDDYMNLVSNYLVGLEENFKRPLDDGRTAYSILPLLSTTVSMQMSYLACGLDYKDDFQLNEMEVDKLQNAMQSLHDDMSKYIPSLADWVDEDAYEIGGSLYNNVMGARGYCAIHGFEHLKIWTQMVEKGSADILVEHCEVVSYSQCIGASTSKFNDIGAGFSNQIPPPILPKLINGRRNKIKSIKGWKSVEIQNFNRVGGLEVRFDNGDAYTLGISSAQGEEPNSIDLNGTYIKKVTCSYDEGHRAINFVTFYLSDERQFTVGEHSSFPTQTLELEGHFVCGFFADQGDSDKVAGFSVSYQLDDPNY